jgi:hypothetical protein
VIEKHLQHLLLSEPHLEIAADQLIRKFALEKTTESELQIISQFLIQCGFYSTLAEFLSKLLEQRAILPWGHFAEGLFQAGADVPEKLKIAMIQGAEAQGRISELSRCHQLDAFEVELAQQRKSLLENAQASYQRRKQESIQEIETLKSQGLIDQETELLEKLQRYYPNDVDVGRLIHDFRERKALGILQQNQNRKSTWVPLEIYEPADPKDQQALSVVTASMNRWLKKYPELVEDFVVAQMTWENFEAALSMIESAQKISIQLLWLKIEAQLKSRKYLELLSSLAQIEINLVSDPEATFAILYYRAQAYWGLGNKYQAIEILESIATSRPSYRATAVLLNEWRGDQ